MNGNYRTETTIPVNHIVCDNSTESTKSMKMMITMTKRMMTAMLKLAEHKEWIKSLHSLDRIRFDKPGFRFIMNPDMD